MKTPEEIKKGLECCARLKFPNTDCDGCPYLVKAAEHLWECKSQEIIADAIAYIRRMESAIDSCWEIAKTMNIEELNALTKVIRCENCAYLARSPWGHPKLGWCKLSGHHRKLDYYCASAKAKEG